jgi:hypothetical protein
VFQSQIIFWRFRHVSAALQHCLQGNGFKPNAFSLELDLELIQTHMTPKPLLWVEARFSLIFGMPVCPFLCLVSLWSNSPSANDMSSQQMMAHLAL